MGAAQKAQARGVIQGSQQWSLSGRLLTFMQLMQRRSIKPPSVRIHQPCFVGGEPRGQPPSPLCFDDTLCLCGGLPKVKFVLKFCLLTAPVECFNTKQVFFTACETPDRAGTCPGEGLCLLKAGDLPS